MKKLPVLLLFTLALSPCAAHAQENFLIIIADDVGVDKIGVYDEGQSPPETPTATRMASGTTATVTSMATERSISPISTSSAHP